MLFLNQVGERSIGKFLQNLLEGATDLYKDTDCRARRQRVAHLGINERYPGLL